MLIYIKRKQFIIVRLMLVIAKKLEESENMMKGFINYGKKKIKNYPK